jgi:hypothetical protein
MSKLHFDDIRLVKIDEKYGKPQKIATELFWKFSSPERLSLHDTKSLPQYQLGKMYFLGKKEQNLLKIVKNWKLLIKC